MPLLRKSNSEKKAVIMYEPSLNYNLDWYFMVCITVVLYNFKGSKWKDVKCWLDSQISQFKSDNVAEQWQNKIRQNYCITGTLTNW